MNSAVLEGYREKSKSYFDEKAKQAAKSNHGLFPPCVTPLGESDRGEDMQAVATHTM